MKSRKKDPLCEECGKPCSDCASFPTLNEVIIMGVLHNAFLKGFTKKDKEYLKAKNKFMKLTKAKK